MLFRGKDGLIRQAYANAKMGVVGLKSVPMHSTYRYFISNEVTDGQSLLHSCPYSCYRICSSCYIRNYGKCI